jgi:hypothetical protein
MADTHDTLTALIILQYVALASLLAGATLLARWWRGVRYAGLVFLANLAFLAATALAFPFYAVYYASVPSAKRVTR